MTLMGQLMNPGFALMEKLFLEDVPEVCLELLLP